ncbi:type II toxin-antitoxin system HicB family antitoxin [Paenibacillus rubinfantis]|uniref:type II toxin-antitoxin system HicB family antitoxin n=1 Tax=Paenibacillus rubinfantis TaxID=1720296 RepID=UPI00073E4AFB|nr:hypothetical protein [Paenibacillus rubinfantis]
MANTMDLLVLFEEDYIEKNVTAYIPAFRIGAIGATLEEARENAIDLVQKALEESKSYGMPLPKGNAIVDSITVVTD